MFFTVILGFIGMNSPAFKSIFVNTPAIIIISVSLIGVSLVIGCCTDFFRRYALPIFIIFTILMALTVAISVSAYSSKVILLAAGITLALTTGLTAFACKLIFLNRFYKK
jgi:hypothetical protein